MMRADLGSTLAVCGSVLLLACGAPRSSSAEPPAVAPEASLARVMVQLVRGDRSLASVIDRERGLVHVAVRSDATGDDPRRGADGVIRVAERYCGAALDEAIARFDRDLVARNVDPLDVPVFTCEGDTCRHRARMEYDVAGAYTFASIDPPRLEHVVEIETAMNEPARAEAERWIATALARLEGGACP